VKMTGFVSTLGAGAVGVVVVVAIPRLLENLGGL